jgi:protein PET100
MGGPNLEVFKVCLSNLYGVANGQFAVYILFPIGIMYHFGTNIEKKFSVPGFWPSKEQSHRIPTDPADLDEELDRLRAIRLEIRRRRLEVMDSADLGTIQRPTDGETPDSSRHWRSPRGREG